jgi:pyruvate dehydrogenase complex dehydrogenase (E1) component
MDLHPIVTYLSMKDMNAREIDADMNDTLGADCFGYSTVTKDLRENVFEVDA